MATIAYFTLNAYDMLTGGYEGSAVGGAQLQQILIGSELQERGHDIYFIEYDAPEKSERSIDGIEVITKPRPSGSAISRARTVITGTRSVLQTIRPDVCYRRSLDFEILPLSYYGRQTDSRFIYHIAHDDELSSSPHKFSSGIKGTKLYHWLNRKALSSASAVIAQNNTQYSIATERLDTDVYQIPNCYVDDAVPPIDWEFESPVVFWAARFQPWKQPELVVQLASELPEITFVMAGDIGDEDLYRRIERKANELPNLHLVGHIPFDEIDRYFAAADLFLNTSSMEGYPNTFLQAWAQSTPVVSYQVNPDSVLTANDIGRVANGSFEMLVGQIQDLTHSDSQRQDLGKASRIHLQEHHSVETIADQFEQVFIEN